MNKVCLVIPTSAITTDYANQYFLTIVISSALGIFIIFALILILCILAAIRRNRLKVENIHKIEEQEVESINKEKIDLIFIGQEKSKSKTLEKSFNNEVFKKEQNLDENLRFKTKEVNAKTNQLNIKERGSNKEIKNTNNKDNSILIAKKTSESSVKKDFSKSTTSLSDDASKSNSEIRNRSYRSYEFENVSVRNNFKTSNQNYKNLEVLTRMKLENNQGYTKDLTDKSLANKEATQSEIKNIKKNFNESKFKKSSDKNFKNKDNLSISKRELIEDGNLKYDETLRESNYNKIEMKTKSQISQVHDNKAQIENEPLKSEKSFDNPNERFNAEKYLKNISFGAFKNSLIRNQGKNQSKSNQENDGNREKIIPNKQDQIFKKIYFSNIENQISKIAKDNLKNNDELNQKSFSENDQSFKVPSFNKNGYEIQNNTNEKEERNKVTEREFKRQNLLSAVNSEETEQDYFGKNSNDIEKGKNKKLQMNNFNQVKDSSMSSKIESNYENDIIKETEHKKHNPLNLKKTELTEQDYFGKHSNIIIENGKNIYNPKITLKSNQMSQMNRKDVLNNKVREMPMYVDVNRNSYNKSGIDEEEIKKKKHYIDNAEIENNKIILNHTGRDSNNSFNSRKTLKLLSPSQISFNNLETEYSFASSDDSNITFVDLNRTKHLENQVNESSAITTRKQNNPKETKNKIVNSDDQFSRKSINNFMNNSINHTSFKRLNSCNSTLNKNQSYVKQQPTNSNIIDPRFVYESAANYHSEISQSKPSKIIAVKEKVDQTHQTLGGNINQNISSLYDRNENSLKNNAKKQGNFNFEENRNKDFSKSLDNVNKTVNSKNNQKRKWYNDNKLDDEYIRIQKNDQSFETKEIVNIDNGVIKISRLGEH